MGHSLCPQKKFAFSQMIQINLVLSFFSAFVNDIFEELPDLIKSLNLSKWQCAWLFEIIEFKDRDWTEDIDTKNFFIELREMYKEKT